MLEAAVLTVCAEAPRYGYELRRVLTANTLVAGQVHPGRLYEVLAGLAEAGALRVHTEASEAGPDRRCYELTPAGRARLARWVLALQASAAALERLLGRLPEVPEDVWAPTHPLATSQSDAPPRSEGGEEAMSCHCDCGGGPGKRGHAREERPSSPEPRPQERSLDERLAAIEAALETLIGR